MSNKTPEIYQPEEDSFLMKGVLQEQLPLILKKNPHLKFLEIGSGSGINLETAQGLGVKDILGIDINSASIKECKKKGFNCIHSNLFENIDESCDLIIFNPPYLPENKDEPKSSRTATTGGKKGSEIINEFLKQAKSHLTNEGKIFLLTSSLTKNINWQNFKRRVLAKKKIFFEELIVWELKL